MNQRINMQLSLNDNPELYQLSASPPAKLAAFSRLYTIFMRFLNGLTNGEAEFESYLQRLLGQALLGEPDKRVFVYLDDQGRGRSGKSSLIHSIREAWLPLPRAEQESYLESVDGPSFWNSGRGLVILTGTLTASVPADNFFWLYVNRIPFRYSFVASPAPGNFQKLADPDILTSLRSETAGILAWLLQGCKEY